LRASRLAKTSFTSSRNSAGGTPISAGGTPISERGMSISASAMSISESFTYAVSGTRHLALANVLKTQKQRPSLLQLTNAKTTLERQAVESVA
jgi:hypothetical protein